MTESSLPAKNFRSLKFPNLRLSGSIGLAVVLHLAFVLPLARHLNIWLDEAWTMQTTADGLLHAWREAATTEHQAPLYFVALAAARRLDDSLFFARLFSIACTTATISLVPSLVKRFVPQISNRTRNLLTIALSLHPYLIWAALEARVYAPVILLSSLLLLFWFDGYAAEPNGKIKTRAIYFSLAVVALYTNYYLGFLLFANACALLALKRWKPLGSYVAQMSAVGLLFAPLVLIIKRQFATNVDYYYQPPTAAAAAREIWNICNHFLLPSAEWELIAPLRVWLARLGAAVLLFLAFKHLKRLAPWTITLSVIAAVVGLFFIAVFFLLGADFIQLRHAAPLFVPLFLTFVALLADLTEDNRGVCVWLALLLIFAPGLLISTYGEGTKNGDWARVARFIERNERENQPIATFFLHDSIPLDFCYRGKNQIIFAGSPTDWSDEDEPLTATRYRRQIESLIAEIPSGKQYLWLVTQSSCHEEKTAVECQPLEDFVRTNYTVEQSNDFYLRRVRLLRYKYYDEKTE